MLKKQTLNNLPTLKINRDIYMKHTQCLSLLLLLLSMSCKSENKASAPAPFDMLDPDPTQILIGQSSFFKRSMTDFHKQMEREAENYEFLIVTMNRLIKNNNQRSTLGSSSDDVSAHDLFLDDAAHDVKLFATVVVPTCNNTLFSIYLTKQLCTDVLKDSLTRLQEIHQGATPTTEDIEYFESLLKDEKARTILLPIANTKISRQTVNGKQVNSKGQQREETLCNSVCYTTSIR